MLHNGIDERLFPTIAGEKIAYLRPIGTEEEYDTGAVLSCEGDSDYPFFIVLSGLLRVTKRIGNEDRLLALHSPGQFTGEISILGDSRAAATVQAQQPTRVLKIENSVFRQLMAKCSPLADLVISALVERARDVEGQTRQQEKLAALGKLSAGLAHELNNPAAAAQEAARSLNDLLVQAQFQALHFDSRFTPDERELLFAMGRQALAHLTNRMSLDPLLRADREDALSDWLSVRGVSESWEHAACLVIAGFTETDLMVMAAGLGEDNFPCGLGWLTMTINLVDLTHDVRQNTHRISDLVGSMKAYSYMDQANFQPVDIHAGLEHTLTILSHRLRNGVDVVREYADDLPLIPAYGSELNQVWTHLIDNALDALNGEGCLWLRTEYDREYLRVEIADNGPGIPATIIDRVWEPFFTTKGVGEGTGLGLDVVRRIITRRHNGQVHVRSEPGNTRFEVYFALQNAHNETAVPLQPEPDLVLS